MRRLGDSSGRFLVGQHKAGVLGVRDEDNGPVFCLIVRVHLRVHETDHVIVHGHHTEPVNKRMSYIQLSYIEHTPLFDRDETHCSTPQAKLKEIKTLRRICKANGYSSGFKQRATRSKRATTMTAETVGWEVLPHINKISGGTARLIVPLGIKISQRPTKTLGTQLIRPKDPLVEKDKSNGIADITCQDCDCHYVGETRKKRMETRLKQHQIAAKQHCAHSQIYEHMALKGHTFNFD